MLALFQHEVSMLSTWTCDFSTLVFNIKQEKSRKHSGFTDYSISNLFHSENNMSNLRVFTGTQI